MDRAAQLLTGFRILIFLRIEAVLKSLNPFVEKSLGPVLWGKVFRQFIEAGTDGYPKKSKRRLMVVNVAAYLIVLASLNYAVLYSVTDFHKYQLIVYANIFLLVLAMLVPFAHRPPLQ